MPWLGPVLLEAVEKTGASRRSGEFGGEPAKRSAALSDTQQHPATTSCHACADPLHAPGEIMLGSAGDLASSAAGKKALINR